MFILFFVSFGFLSTLNPRKVPPLLFDIHLSVFILFFRCCLTFKKHLLEVYALLMGKQVSRHSSFWNFQNHESFRLDAAHKLIGLKRCHIGILRSSQKKAFGKIASEKNSHESAVNALNAYPEQF